MTIKYVVLSFIFIISACLPAGLSASDVQKKFLDNAADLKKPKPPTDTPSGNNPADSGNPGKPGDATNPSDPGKSGNPGNPPEETPSGTEPADPGENPADPANKDKTKPEDADKDLKDKDAKDAKDKKGKKDKPRKGGKSGGGKGGLSLPSAPTPPSGAALAPAGGAVAGGIIGGLFSGGKKEEKKEEKKEIPPPAPKETPKEEPKEAAASTETVKTAEPVQVSTPAADGVALDTAPVQGDDVEPLYSEGPGPKIAVIDFEGEHGAQFAELLTEALKADLKVYNRTELAAKKYETQAVTRVSAKKIAAEAAVEYVVTGKIALKTETLSIISIFLRDGKTGDIKMTDNQSLRSLTDLKSIAENAAGKIKERISTN